MASWKVIFNTYLLIYLFIIIRDSNKKVSNTSIEELHKAKLKMIQERDRIKQEKIAMIKVVNSQKKSSNMQMVSPRNSDKFDSDKKENNFISLNSYNTNDEESDDHDEYLNNKVISNTNVQLNDINSDLDMSKK